MVNILEVCVILIISVDCILSYAISVDCILSYAISVDCILSYAKQIDQWMVNIWNHDFFSLKNKFHKSFHFDAMHQQTFTSPVLKQLWPISVPSELIPREQSWEVIRMSCVQQHGPKSSHIYILCYFHGSPLDEMGYLLQGRLTVAASGITQQAANDITNAFLQLH